MTQEQNWPWEVGGKPVSTQPDAAQPLISTSFFLVGVYKEVDRGVFHVPPSQTVCVDRTGVCSGYSPAPAPLPLRPAPLSPWHAPLPPCPAPLTPCCPASLSPYPSPLPPALRPITLACTPVSLPCTPALTSWRLEGSHFRLIQSQAKSSPVAGLHASVAEMTPPRALERVIREASSQCDPV